MERISDQCVPWWYSEGGGLLISVAVPWQAVFSYVGKVFFSLVHKLGIAANILKLHLAVRLCSENVSLLMGLESQRVLGLHGFTNDN